MTLPAHMSDSAAPERFVIAVPDTKLRWIEDRVRGYPWDALADAGGWDCGTSVGFMRELAGYWLDLYDWREAEQELNRFPQYRVAIDGVDLHYYHVPSLEPEARPLLLLHGWPGSVLEFQHLISPLVDPVSHGGTARDAFHVVIPSLPGFGFSGRPARPIGPARIATMMTTLMADILGYDRYIAQGGDWGAVIATLLGHRYTKHCRGIHINMLIPEFGHPPESEEERAWEERRNATQQREGGYGHIQTTRPQTLGFAMADSPVGVAAWIIEKFLAWSDFGVGGRDEAALLSLHSRDRLLTNAMLYLVNDNFSTAAWLYRGFAEEFAGSPFASGARCPTPTGIAAFPDPLFEPQPRSMAARSYNVAHWTDMPRGGHFAALEAPELFLEDLRSFGGSLPEMG